MALARIKTWISEILTAADLNAEFNNILNNATSLISPATAAWDMDGKELILDADADTSITADTDDQIDFKAGGTDIVRITASGLNVAAGSATVAAGDINMTAGAINTARATVASAATTADIWAANGNQIDWTGTTTCTGFPAAPQAGVSRTLMCADAAPFTAGANMEIDGVSSGATVTCAAKDKMIVEAVTTTQFRLSRIKYNKPLSQPTKQIFTSSGTYTKPAGLVVAIIEVCGAGGGGGGAVNGNASHAGGGGGGAVTRSYVLASSIGATETVTVGAGGTGGADGSTNGANGGQSSFGALVTAPGGVGGVAAAAADQEYAGGAGGGAGTGDATFVGSSGLPGLYCGAARGPSGAGGGSHFGAGGAPVLTGSAAGNTGLQYGGGGGGARDNGTILRAGGNGFAGVVIVTEYY